MHSLLILLFILAYAMSRELMMIQQTFRHGARYPLYFSAADHSDIVLTLNSLGELTTEGKYMHYLLGKIIYQQYWEQLFKGTQYQNAYSQSQIFVKSTDTNRTIQSAQSHLLGLLQKLPKLSLNRSNYQYSLPAWNSFKQETNISQVFQIFESAPSFHPIPIHVQKGGATSCDGGDFLTKYDVASCPNQKFWGSQNLNSDQSSNIMRDPRIKEALAALSKQVGQEVDFTDLFKWKSSDTCLKYLGYPRLQIFDNPKYSDIFDFIYVYSTYLINYSQKDQIAAVSTEYFMRTLSNLEGKINSTFTPKIVIYSGHDTTIGLILAAMDMVNTKCIVDHYLNGVKNDDTCVWQYPPFTANVIFQLWNNGGEYSIRVLYNGQVRKLPMCDYKIECSFTEFKTWVNSFAVDNVALACGYVGDAKTYYAVIFIMLSAIIIFVVYIVFLHAKIRKIDTIGRAKRQGYEQNFQEKIQEKQQQLHSH